MTKTRSLPRHSWVIFDMFKKWSAGVHGQKPCWTVSNYNSLIKSCFLLHCSPNRVYYFLKILDLEQQALEVPPHVILAFMGGSTVT